VLFHNVSEAGTEAGCAVAARQRSDNGVQPFAGRVLLAPHLAECDVAEQSGKLRVCASVDIRLSQL
jgi:hypothetical protein